MATQNVRLEVMQFLEKKIDSFVDEFLIPVEKIWQPTDLLPNSQNETFFEEVKELQEIAKDLPYDFWVTLIGDTITEEALPTYESWLLNIDGVNQEEQTNGWNRWFRQWTGEENRHGDLLNKYLYLSGRVNMKEVEITTCIKYHCSMKMAQYFMVCLDIYSIRPLIFSLVSLEKSLLNFIIFVTQSV